MSGLACPSLMADQLTGEFRTNRRIGNVEGGTMTKSDGSPADTEQNRALLWLAQGAGMFVLTVLFLLIVMTAVAQQEVIASIKQQQLSLGYSAALSVNDEAKGINEELRGLRNEARGFARQLRTDQVNFNSAQRRWEDDWDELNPFLERLAQPCDIDLPKDKSFGGREAALYDLRQCIATASAGRDGSPLLLAAKKPADDFAEVSSQYRDALDAFSKTKDKLDAARAQMVATVLSDEQQKVNSSFSEMNVLFSNWLLIGGFLVLFPPALLQILLTFFSGMFGAIVVTLVLLVYPKSKFDITASKETWARVFLGGLIALCVYIVLLGGTAVVGASSGLSGAGTNYMAFCGIGILAGMFSDRVAFWLSDRADVFFRKGAGAAVPRPAAGTTAAPPPPAVQP